MVPMTPEPTFTTTKEGCQGHNKEAVTAIKLGELEHWKKTSDYHQRSQAETASYRCFKQLIGPKLSLRSYNTQEGDILASVKVMN